MTYTHHMNLDGQNVALAIMDTAGEVSKFNWRNKQTNKQKLTTSSVDFSYPSMLT